MNRGIERSIIDFSTRLAERQTSTNLSDPPPLNWSTVYDRKRRINDGNQATQTRRDSLEAATG